jgi:hypothetical protein
MVIPRPYRLPDISTEIGRDDLNSGANGTTPVTVDKDALAQGATDLRKIRKIIDDLTKFFPRPLRPLHN